MSAAAMPGRYDGLTVAITGGSGYLASALRDAMRASAARVLLVSRQALPPSAGVESLQGDVRTRECWDAIVARADVIFHLAGNTSVYAAAKDPAASLQSTVLPVTHLAAAAEAAGRTPRVVFASTATVYGLTGTLPAGEDTPTRPITSYDLHKLFAERELQLASHRAVLEGVSLRLANVYGPSAGLSGSADRGVLNKIARMALQGAGLRIFGDGNYVRDYVYIDDVVRAFLLAGVEGGVVGQSFNVGGGSGVTVSDAFHMVIERAAQVTGRRADVQYVAWPADADPIEFRNYTADVRALTAACGWTPAVQLRDGIDRLVAALLDPQVIDG